jgi:hypothetical protein
MKQQLVTNTIRHNEIPALGDSWITNTSLLSKFGKGKVKVYPRTGHEGPEGK